MRSPAIVFLLAAMLVCGPASATPWSGSSRAAPGASPPFLVYYFHNHLRCDTCRSMESLTLQTVDYDFVEQVERGRLAVQALDVQDDGNEHFVREFGLDGPTLILAEKDMEGRTLRWENLDRIWELADRPEAFRRYVRDRLRTFMAAETPGEKK